MSIYASGEKQKGQDSGKPDNESFLADDANLISDRIEAITEEINPTTQSPITFPLVFDQNRRFTENQTGNISFTLAGSGHSTGFVYSEYVINGDSTNNITWDITNILLAGDSFDSTKKNTVVLVWDGESIVRASNQISDIGTITPTTPTITSTIVTSANPDQIQITFNVTPTAGTMTGFTMNGDFADITIGSILTQVANVWTVQLSRSVLNGETGFLVWVSSDIENSGELLADGFDIVDNQTGDITAPTLSNVSVDNITDTTAVFNATPSEVSDIVWAVFSMEVLRDAASYAIVEAGIGAIDYGIIEDAPSGLPSNDGITGLSNETQYYLRCYAKDASDNESIAYDVDFQSTEAPSDPSTIESNLFYSSTERVFDGTNSDDLGSPFNVPFNSGTYELWFMASPVDGQSSPLQIIMGGRDGDNLKRFQAIINTTGFIMLNSSDGTDSFNFQFGTAILPDGASDNVFRFSMDSGTPTLYLNGTAYAVTSSSSPGTASNRVDNLFVGAGNNGGDEFNYEGTVSEIAIFDEVLIGDDLTDMNNFYDV